MKSIAFAEHHVALQLVREHATSLLHQSVRLGPQNCGP